MSSIRSTLSPAYEMSLQIFMVPSLLLPGPSPGFQMVADLPAISLLVRVISWSSGRDDRL